MTLALWIICLTVIVSAVIILKHAEKPSPFDYSLETDTVQHFFNELRRLHQDLRSTDTVLDERLLHHAIRYCGRRTPFLEVAIKQESPDTVNIDVLVISDYQSYTLRLVTTAHRAQKWAEQVHKSIK